MRENYYKEKYYYEIQADEIHYAEWIQKNR